MSTKNLKVDTLLVGFTTNGDKASDILTVGRKRENGSVEIINAIQGVDATCLYKKLSEKKYPLEAKK